MCYFSVTGIIRRKGAGDNAYFFPYTVGKIFDGRKSPKLMFFRDLINSMVGKVPCLLKMRWQLKNRNSRKNHGSKWSGKSLFEMLGICNFLCILEIFLDSSHYLMLNEAF